MITYLNGMIRLQYVETQGAFLGFGSKMPAIFRFYFFCRANDNHPNNLSAALRDEKTWIYYNASVSSNIHFGRRV